MTVHSTALFAVTWAALDRPRDQDQITLHPLSLPDVCTAIEERLAGQWRAFCAANVFPPETREEWLAYKHYAEHALRPPLLIDDRGQPDHEQIVLHSIDTRIDPRPDEERLNSLLAQARDQLERAPTGFAVPDADQSYLRGMLGQPLYSAKLYRHKPIYHYMRLTPAPFPYPITPHGNAPARRRLERRLAQNPVIAQT